MTYLRAVALLLLLVLCNPTHAESLAEISARVGADTDKAFAGCVYLDQSRDYFVRFSRGHRRHTHPRTTLCSTVRGGLSLQAMLTHW